MPQWQVIYKTLVTIRDGYSTSGEYRVALPDGRVQVVTYKADENGYHADVRSARE